MASTGSVERHADVLSTACQRERQGSHAMVELQSPFDRVIYIVGDGRSGSTLLSVLLGSLPTVESVGELYRWIEFRGLPTRGPVKPEDAEFWRSIREAYFLAGGEGDFGRLEAAQAEVERYVNFPKCLLGLGRPSLRRIYEEHTAHVLSAIASVGRKALLVDSSRNMGRACAIARMYPGRVWLVHLVRDPRAVVRSYTRKNVEQPPKSAGAAALQNAVKNLLSSSLRAVVGRGHFTRLRYEDLVNHPEETLRGLGDFLGIDTRPAIVSVQSSAPLAVPHLLDGNRIRHQHQIVLQRDDAWRQELSPRDRWLAVLGTFPLFLLYGYASN